MAYLRNYYLAVLILIYSYGDIFIYYFSTFYYKISSGLKVVPPFGQEQQTFLFDGKSAKKCISLCKKKKCIIIITENVIFLSAEKPNYSRSVRKRVNRCNMWIVCVPVNGYSKKKNVVVRTMEYTL